MKKVIVAEVMQMPVTTFQLSFTVKVISPVELPPRIYNVSMQEVLVRADNTKRVVYEVLTEKVLSDYNKLIEDSPIMDMFTDPDKYEICSYVEWIDFDFKWKEQDLNL